jgi:hypothetical protein
MWQYYRYIFLNIEVVYDLLRDCSLFIVQGETEEKLYLLILTLIFFVAPLLRQVKFSKPPPPPPIKLVKLQSLVAKCCKM